MKTTIYIIFLFVFCLERQLPATVNSQMGTHLLNCWKQKFEGRSYPQKTTTNDDPYQEFIELLFAYKFDFLNDNPELAQLNIPDRSYVTYLVQEWDSIENFCLYFRTISELSQELYPQLLKEVGLKEIPDNVVIHYRLSDVPFCRNRAHHLQFYSYYLEGLEEIKKANIDCSEIEVVTSFKHGQSLGKSPQDLNQIYLKDFVNFLEENGYKVKVSTEGTILEDFAKIVLAPAVITSSSCYSFIAGLANKNFAFFPQLVSEKHLYKEELFKGYSFNPHSKISSSFA